MLLGWNFRDALKVTYDIQVSNEVSNFISNKYNSFFPANAKKDIPNYTDLIGRKALEQLVQAFYNENKPLEQSFFLGCRAFSARIKQPYIEGKACLEHVTEAEVKANDDWMGWLEPEVILLFLGAYTACNRFT